MIDLHAHAVLPDTFGAAGSLGPTLSPIGEPPCFSIGDYQLVGVDYRGSAFMEVDVRLGEMSRLGISHAVLSPNPLTFLCNTDPEVALQFARTSNDAMARLVAPHSTLDGFAQIALQDPSSAATELGRAVESLGLKGAYVGTDYGLTLDTPALDEFWQTASDLGVPVFIHPAPGGIDAPRRDERLARFDADLWMGFCFEETIAVATLVLGGVLDRFGELDICISHGGGAIPVLAERMAHAAESRRIGPAALHDPGAVAERLGRLWWDCHIGGPTALASLRTAFGDDRLVGGTNMAGWDQSDDPSHGDQDLAKKLDKNARTLLQR